MFLLIASQKHLEPPILNYTIFCNSLCFNESIFGWRADSVTVGHFSAWLQTEKNRSQLYQEMEFFKQEIYGFQEGAFLICHYTLPNIYERSLILRRKLTNSNYNPKVERQKNYRKRLLIWHINYDSNWRCDLVKELCEANRESDAIKVCNLLYKREQQISETYISQSQKRLHPIKWHLRNKIKNFKNATFASYNHFSFFWQNLERFMNNLHNIHDDDIN